MNPKRTFLFGVLSRRSGRPLSRAEVRAALGGDRDWRIDAYSGHDVPVRQDGRDADADLRRQRGRAEHRAVACG